ncbi:MAG: hypothetical protein ACFB8W_08810, partial [Elainellaceae cyanobacterium]
MAHLHKYSRQFQEKSEAFREVSRELRGQVLGLGLVAQAVVLPGERALLGEAELLASLAAVLAALPQERDRVLNLLQKVAQDCLLAGGLG